VVLALPDRPLRTHPGASMWRRTNGRKSETSLRQAHRPLLLGVGVTTVLRGLKRQSIACLLKQVSYIP
jgi:hypothetical protein